MPQLRAAGYVVREFEMTDPAIYQKYRNRITRYPSFAVIDWETGSWVSGVTVGAISQAAAVRMLGGSVETPATKRVVRHLGESRGPFVTFSGRAGEGSTLRPTAGPARARCASRSRPCSVIIGGNFESLNNRRRPCLRNRKEHRMIWLRTCWLRLSYAAMTSLETLVAEMAESSSQLPSKVFVGSESSLILFGRQSRGKT
jgi:hypothetical protein